MSVNADGEKIMRLIAEANVIAITGHVRPDGDAIGACCAMAQCAAKMWKSVFVFLDDYSEAFNCIPGGDFRFTGDPDSVRPDIFIALDCGSRDRIGDKYAKLFDDCAITVNIDHHMSNTFFADYNFVLETASSTCQILFDLINMYVLIDEGIAGALYAGLVYDTGGFRHAGTTAKTHETAARLLGVGFEHSEIYNRLMFQHSLREAKCLGKAIDNVYMTGEIAASFITYEELTELGASGKDLEGIVEYLLGINGVEAAIFANGAGENESKVSFRSKKIDVGKIARDLGGGGHLNAAGASLKKTADDAARFAVDILMDKF